MKKLVKKNISSKYIEEKIHLETKNLKQPLLGKKKIEIIRPFATNFLELLNQNTTALESAIDHPFTKWINEQACFKKAYHILLNERLISDKNDKNTKLFFCLEIIMANLIHFLSEHISEINLVPSKKTADLIYTKMRSLRNDLKNFGGIYCNIESKQYLLQHLLDDVLNEQREYNRSLYSSGMPRDIMRALFTKRIIFSLWMFFVHKKPSPRVVAKIASSMISIFFKPIDISDATDIAKQLEKNIIEDEKFRKNTIESYLLQSLSKGAG